MRETESRVIKLTPLKRFNLIDGDVLHAMKSNEAEYKGFEEAYFSIIKKGKIKGWKRHLKMTMNLVVPIGSVLFIFYNDSGQKLMQVTIGEENYCRITVPPKIWFGFTGKSKKDNIILNISNVMHDPSEVEKRPLNSIEFREE